MDRRNKFFVNNSRRSIVINNLFMDENQRVPAPALAPAPIRAEPVTTDAYIQSLEREKAQWKELLRQIKDRHREEKYGKENVMARSLAEPNLSAADIQLLSEAPDYSGLIDRANEMIDASLYMAYFKDDMVHFKNGLREELVLMIATEFGRRYEDSPNVCEVCNNNGCRGHGSV